MSDIENAIPHRPPFLLVDRILETTEESIRCETDLNPEHELWRSVYAGHYPGQPITPGVLLCEMVFQAAAVLMSQKLADDGEGKMPVLTRISSAKFREMVLPGDTVEVSASLTEQVANACYMSGTVKKNGKLAVRVEFAVALVNSEG